MGGPDMASSSGRYFKEKNKYVLLFKECNITDYWEGGNKRPNIFILFPLPVIQINPSVN